MIINQFWQCIVYGQTDFVLLIDQMLISVAVSFFQNFPVNIMIVLVLVKYLAKNELWANKFIAEVNDKSTDKYWCALVVQQSKNLFEFIEFQDVLYQSCIISFKRL